MNGTESLARFVAQLEYDDVPQEARIAAKRAVLDGFGAMIYGTTTEWAELGRQYVFRYGCCGSSAVIGTSRKVSPRDAALLNGLFAHGFELDDTHVASISHPGSVVLPAAMAVIPSSERSGRQFLTAVIAGYEVMARVGAAVAPSHISNGFHPTATVGVFGAAAAAAAMMRLQEAEIVSALGIAGSFCSGITEFANDPRGDMVKRLHAGKAAESGVMAAQLASSGYRGPRSVLEGQHGFLRTFAKQSNRRRLVEGLGQAYEIAAVSFKPYACCSNIFCVIDAVKDIIGVHGVQTDTVQSVVVNTNRDSVQYHGRNKEIDSIGAAQYSIPYVVAVTLAGMVDDPSRAFSESTMQQRRIVELTRLTTVKLDRELDALFPEKEAARVTIRLHNGRELESVVTSATGTIDNPLSKEQLEKKFRRLSADLLPGEVADRMVAMVGELDAADDVESVIGLLCFSLNDLASVSAQRKMSDDPNESDHSAKATPPSETCSRVERT